MEIRKTMYVEISLDNLINKDKIVDNEKVNINYLLQT